MGRFGREPQHAHGNTAQTAVLLVNLGTPDAPTAPAVRRYLKQFLSDPRVVEIPAVVWQPILRGIILNIRPAKSATDASDARSRCSNRALEPGWAARSRSRAR